MHMKYFRMASCLFHGATLKKTTAHSRIKAIVSSVCELRAIQHNLSRMSIVEREGDNPVKKRILLSFHGYQRIQWSINGALRHELQKIEIV